MNFCILTTVQFYCHRPLINGIGFQYLLWKKSLIDKKLIFSVKDELFPFSIIKFVMFQTLINYLTMHLLNDAHSQVASCSASLLKGKNDFQFFKEKWNITKWQSDLLFQHSVKIYEIFLLQTWFYVKNQLSTFENQENSEKF